MIDPSTTYSRFVPGPPAFPYEAFNQIAAECSNDDIIVEVGAFLGHGTCYMAECLARYDKRPKFYAIDVWDGQLEPHYGETRTSDMPWGETIHEWRARGGRLYDSFCFYLDQCPHKDRLYDHVGFPPATCMDEFSDNSISFVYLGYSKTEARIQEEIKRWMPKLKSGGRLVTCMSNEGHIQSIPKS